MSFIKESRMRPKESSTTNPTTTLETSLKFTLKTILNTILNTILKSKTPRPQDQPQAYKAHEILFPLVIYRIYQMILIDKTVCVHLVCSPQDSTFADSSNWNDDYRRLASRINGANQVDGALPEKAAFPVLKANFRLLRTRSSKRNYIMRVVSLCQDILKSISFHFIRITTRAIDHRGVCMCL